MNTYGLRNSKTGRLFTDLQKYVILELPKLPDEDDGQAAWPQLRFLKCREEEEMELLAKKHPEMRPLVADYKQMTLLERFRKRAEAREKDRRDTWAALEYARDEGREEVHAELDQVIMAKDQAIEELRRKLRGQGRRRGHTVKPCCSQGLPRLGLPFVSFALPGLVVQGRAGQQAVAGSQALVTP